jgi:hypothetical protein
LLCLLVVLTRVGPAALQLTCSFAGTGLPEPKKGAPAASASPAESKASSSAAAGSAPAASAGAASAAGVPAAQSLLDEWFEAAGASGKVNVQRMAQLLDENKGRLDINATTAIVGYTALALAIDAKNTEAVTLLLSRGADVNKTNKNPEERPLWLASQRGLTAIVHALIAGGAKVNEVTKYAVDRPTALHAAAQAGYSMLAAAEWGNSLTVRALLEAGADAGISNSAGKTAADLAKHEAIKAVFAEFAAKSASATGTSPHQCLLAFTRHHMVL